MAGFDAAGSVEPLEFSFKPYVDCAGVIPEPAPAQLRRFFKTMRDLFDVADDASPDEIAKKADMQEMERLDDASLQAIADLCQGTPDLESLKGLPVRPQRAFFRWFLSEMQDPNASTPATKS